MSKVRGSLIYPCRPFLLQKTDVLKNSFEKLSTAQLTCSEGALFQYMVMRNVQLTGLYQEEVYNKVGEGEKEEDGTMLQSTLNYLWYTGRHGQIKKKHVIYGEIGSLR